MSSREPRFWCLHEAEFTSIRAFLSHQGGSAWHPQESVFTSLELFVKIIMFYGLIKWIMYISDAINVLHLPTWALLSLGSQSLFLTF